ncbi:hypothetical protein D3C81_1759950 [compost metagenome]
MAPIGRDGQMRSLARCHGAERSPRVCGEDDRLAVCGGQHPGGAALGSLKFGPHRRYAGQARDLCQRQGAIQWQGDGRRRLDTVLAAHGLDRNGGHDQAAPDPEQHLYAHHQADPFVDLGRITQDLHRFPQAQGVAAHEAVSDLYAYRRARPHALSRGRAVARVL